MLTPQEVSTHVFSKARMGGYNMAMVDEVPDPLTEDYTTLYKENAALKAKLKVLVDKVEEYRATEDSMRATLLTAQKMASQMVQEAEKEKADLLAAAESEMGARKAALEAEIAAESERLRLAKGRKRRIYCQYAPPVQQRVGISRRCTRNPGKRSLGPGRAGRQRG